MHILLQHAAHKVLLTQAVDDAFENLFGDLEAAQQDKNHRERSDGRFYINGESKYYNRLICSIREDIRDLEEVYA